MPITGLDGKQLTVAIVQAELDRLELVHRTRRKALRALKRALECEAIGCLPLHRLQEVVDATDDGTMDLPPTLRPDADDAPEADGRSDGDPEGRALALAQEHQRVREKMAGRPEGWKVKEQVPGPHDANSVESDLPDPDDFVDRTPGAGA